MKKKKTASVDYDEWLKKRLKADPKLAAEYMNTAIAEAIDEDGNRMLLSVIRQVVEAQGIGKVAKVAGVRRESLSRVLSPRGNPRMSTLIAILHALGLQLSVSRTVLRKA